MTPAQLLRTRLAAFAEDLFASIPRKDQRRWGQTYLRGLLLDGKRKSIQPMAAPGWPAAIPIPPPTPTRWSRPSAAVCQPIPLGPGPGAPPAGPAHDRRDPASGVGHR